MPTKVPKAVRKLIDDEGIKVSDVVATGGAGTMTAGDVVRAISRMARDGTLLSASVADQERYGESERVEPDPVPQDITQEQADQRAADERVAAGGSIWHEEAREGLDHNARKVSRRQIEEEERDRKREESKASSRPWNSENRRRFHVDRLHVARKKTGWVDRWVLKSNIEIFMQEGWDLASRRGRGQLRDPRLSAVVQQGNGDLFERGNLVLMETPAEFNQDRNKHVQALTAAQATSPTDQAISAGVSERDGHFGEQRRPKRRARDADVAPVERTGAVGDFLA